MRIATVSFAAILMAGVASEGTATQSTATGKTEARLEAGMDGLFMKDAAAAGMAEVELGRMAADKAMRPEVKDFARMMVEEHSKANEELKSLAAKKSVTLPSEPKPEQKAKKEELSKLSGAAFDKAYVDLMVKQHEKAVELFSRQADSGTDPEAKSWASQTLPRVKHHLAKAKELGQKTTGDLR